MILKWNLINKTIKKNNNKLKLIAWVQNWLDIEFFIFGLTTNYLKRKIEINKITKKENKKSHQISSGLLTFGILR